MLKQRRSSKFKTDVVLELLRGETLESLSRKYGVTMGEIDSWRNDFIENGRQGFKKDPNNSKLAEAQRKIGQLEMEIELIKKKATHSSTTKKEIAKSLSKEVYSKSGKPFPMWLVLKVSDCSSSTFYGDSSHDDKVTKRGRKPILDDSDLLNLIKEKINSSPFFGEGYRKIWYKLRRDGFSVDKARVLKIMRNNNLLSPYRTEQCKKVSHRHDSKITTSAPNLMWGTDGKMFFIEGLGWAWLFAVIDHFNDEIIAWHVSLKGDRFAAMEPIKKAVKLRFGSISKNICNHLPLRLRSDHGTQYDSKDFMNEMAFLGLKMSKSFVREPQCNGCIERFNRTIEQEVFSVAHICSIDDAIERISKFVDDYNSEWFIHRLQMTPIEFRRAYEAKQISFGEANDIYDACVTTESVSDSQG